MCCKINNNREPHFLATTLVEDFLEMIQCSPGNSEGLAFNLVNVFSRSQSLIGNVIQWQKLRFSASRFPTNPSSGSGRVWERTPLQSPETGCPPKAGMTNTSLLAARILHLTWLTCTARVFTNLVLTFTLPFSKFPKGGWGIFLKPIPITATNV